MDDPPILVKFPTASGGHALARVHCMQGSCNRRVKSRGLCDRHANVLWRRVHAGQTTWEALEKAGLCLPAAKNESSGCQAVNPGGEYTADESAFLRAVAEYRQEHQLRFMTAIDHLRVLLAMGYRREVAGHRAPS